MGDHIVWMAHQRAAFRVDKHVAKAFVIQANGECLAHYSSQYGHSLQKWAFSLPTPHPYRQHPLAGYNYTWLGASHEIFGMYLF